MASLQTILTTHKDAAKPVNILTQVGTYNDVVIVDDGAVGDSIVVKDKGGYETLVPKSMIGGVPNAVRPST